MSEASITRAPEFLIEVIFLSLELPFSLAITIWLMELSSEFNSFTFLGWGLTFILIIIFVLLDSRIRALFSTHYLDEILSYRILQIREQIHFLIFSGALVILSFLVRFLWTPLDVTYILLDITVLICWLVVPYFVHRIMRYILRTFREIGVGSAI